MKDRELAELAERADNGTMTWHHTHHMHSAGGVYLGVVGIKGQPFFFVNGYQPAGPHAIHGSLAKKGKSKASVRRREAGSPWSTRRLSAANQYSVR